MTSKTSMLKTSVLFVALALLPLSAAKASAQQKHVIVDVPFAFVANHTQLPAGHYRILAQGPFLTFSNADTGSSQAVLLSRTEGGHSTEDVSKLEFYVSGSRHVLTQVRFGGTGTWNVLLRQPKPELSVAQNAEPGQKIEIAMR